MAILLNKKIKLRYENNIGQIVTLLIDQMLEIVVLINYNRFTKHLSITFNSCRLMILDLSAGSTNQYKRNKFTLHF